MTHEDSPTEHIRKCHWSVEVSSKEARLDSHGREVLADIYQLGLEHIKAVRSSRVYLFEGSLAEAEVGLLALELLTDPVCELYELGPGLSRRGNREPAIEVHPLPGVMNPAALSTQDAATRLLVSRGIKHPGIQQVQTARRYQIFGARNAEELELIAKSALANDCIEIWFIRGFGRLDRIPKEFPKPPRHSFRLRHVDLCTLDDSGLAQLSREAHLFLAVEEMQAIRGYFEQLGRDPTDLELETLAQTWSEHCVHKTLKSAIDYAGEDFGRPGPIKTSFENLLKDTIAAATRKLNRQWCLSVFEDNAGVIAFDDEYGVAFKVETHNHPSAIEPYGGAATGVGGCIRDIMGCGLGAKPIASTDVFCLAPPDLDRSRLPQGVLHPRRVLKGVVGGVRDYGNRMGIPTVNGAIHFDERFLANPLVFCGCVGLIPMDRIHKKPMPGDFIVVAGGRTGRDGIHGATFSSAELSDSHADEFSHAVQIGNAIVQKRLLDAQLRARDHADGCLYSAVTDCGAGGLSSAVGEMGADCGAVVDLEKVPLKYTGLRYDEIWISEAQERMVFAVAPNCMDKFMTVFASEEVEATVIGRFTHNRVLKVCYDGETVGELDMTFLHEGRPAVRRIATWSRQAEASDNVITSGEGSSRRSVRSMSRLQGTSADAPATNERLLAALRDLNVCSKEWVIRQYDHEVQGRSVVKPLVGTRVGPSDAAVLRPRYDYHRGIALGCGLCPQWSEIDPYWMAVLAVDEALRNVICVGADPKQTAILDNFCWPKTDSPQSLGALVRACRGAHDAAVAYGLPFISGKDSLNNEFTMSETEARRTGLPARIAIPPTLLISAVGIVPDVHHCLTMDLKKSGHAIVLASHPVITPRSLLTDEAPENRLEAAFGVHSGTAELIQASTVRAAHDISDGGLGVTLAEMCIASGLGLRIDLDRETAKSLFEPVATTYVLEMSLPDAQAAGLPIIGTIAEEPRLTIKTQDAHLIDLSVADLSLAWRSPLAKGGLA